MEKFGDFQSPSVFFPLNEVNGRSPCVIVPPLMMVQEITENINEKKPVILRGLKGMSYILDMFKERPKSTTKLYGKESNEDLRLRT
ncbi:hypothetical protein H8356DRAFT_1423573 [Neocallimastix lanati (nom. inval.)]|nr:hypothetical protein H8356DRAFT_1423573 [Neocallimastix sp. JGI-2020a]